MSHLTKVKTKLNDPGKLERALKYLGFTYVTGQKINTINQVDVAEFVITNAGYWNVGLLRDKDGVYEVIGDSVSWDGMQGFPNKMVKIALGKVKGDDRRDAFVGILAQAVAITTALSEATKLGHEIYISEPDDEGFIRASVIEASV